MKPKRLTVREGKTATYNVQLATDPQGVVTVTPRSEDTDAATVSGALTFDASNWSTSQPVTVEGVVDVDDADATTSITHDVQGYGAVDSAASVRVNVKDLPPLAVHIEPTTLSVDENGSATYDVWLGSQPERQVTITPTSSDVSALTVSGSLKFMRNAWQKRKTFTVTAPDDADMDSETVTISHAVRGGGSTASAADVTVQVYDDDIPTVSLALSSSSISENGGATTVTATLSAASSTTVTVDVSATRTGGDGSFTVSPNKTLTIAAGSTMSTGTVTITATDNDVDGPDTTLMVSGSASGGGVAHPDWQTLTIIDDDVAEVVVKPKRLTVREGKTATYNVHLATDPQGTVTVTPRSEDTGAATVSGALTFNSSNWLTAQDVTVTGVIDADDVDAKTSITHDVQGYGAVVSAASVQVSVMDLPPLAVHIEPTTLSVDENGSATYDVWLGSQPARQVTITPTSSDVSALTVSGPLKFRRNAWQKRKTITVTAQDDADMDNETVTISHAVRGGGSTASAESVTAQVYDDDTPTVSLVLSQGSISENGGVATLTAALSAATSTAVTVDVSATRTSGSGAFTMSTNKQLMISAGATMSTGTVTITATNNDVDAPDTTVTVAGTASGGGIADPISKTLTITDDDVAEVVVKPKRLTVREGKTATYNVQLATDPQGVVTVTPRSEDTDAATVSGALTFDASNWSTSQPVTVEGVVDVDDADATTSITHDVQGYGAVDSAASVRVNVKDLPPLAVHIEPTTLSVDENGSATYDVWLGSQPERQVTITPTSSDVSALTVSGSLKFMRNAWQKRKTFTVTAPDDADMDSETVTISHAVRGGGSTASAADVTVQVYDDDIPTVSLALSSSSISENGGATTVTATLSAASSTTVTVDVSATRTGGDGSFTVSPNKTLTIAAGSTMSTGTVTITATDNDVDGPDTTLMVSGSASGGGVAHPDWQTLTIIDDDVAEVVVKPKRLTVREGKTATYNVHLATDPQGTVTVTPRSEDTGAATVSGALTFNSSNWLTAQDVTVTGVIDADDVDAKTSITHDVQGYGAVVSAASVQVSVMDLPPLAVHIEPTTLSVDENGSATYDVWLGSQPARQVTITPTSSDVSALTVSGPLKFRRNAWQKRKTITVTAQDDADMDNETVTISHAVRGGGSTASAESVTAQVYDDDTPTVSLVLSQGSISENGGVATLTAALSAATSTAVTVDVSATRTSGSGAFTMSTNKQLMISAGATMSTGTVTITATNNDVDAPDTTVTVAGTASGGGIADPISKTLTITDDEAKPTVSLSLSSSSISENGESSTVIAKLSGKSSAMVTVTVAATQTSGSGSFELSTNKILTIAAETTNSKGDVTITATDNDVEAPNTTVTVAGTVSGGNGIANPASLTLTITDDEGRSREDRTTAPQVNIEPNSLDLKEGESRAYEVWLSTQPDQQITVIPKSSNKRAVSVSGSIKFGRNSWNQRKLITVTAKEDKNRKDEEVFISHDVKDYIDGVLVPSVVVRVTDDDEPQFQGGSGASPALTFTPAAVTVTEAVGDSQSTTYTVRLATQPTAPVTVSLTSNNETAATVDPDILNFTSGNWQLPQQVTVTGVDDALDNRNDRRVNIAHSVSGGNYGAVTGKVSVTVTDNEATSLFSIADARVAEGDSGTADLTFTISINPPGDTVGMAVFATTDNTAKAGSDYTRVSKWVRIEAGETEATVTVSVNGDGVDEGDETLGVSLDHPRWFVEPYFWLVGPGLGDASAIGTIVDDDDGASSFSIADARVREGDSGQRDLVFNVTLNPSATVNSTVNWTSSKSSTDTATPGTDYSAANGTLSFMSGETLKTAIVKVTGDELDENDETLSLTLSGETSGFGVARRNATGTIVDDDVPGFVFTPTSVSVTEAWGDTRTSTYTVALASRPHSSTVSVGLKSRNPSAATVHPETLSFNTSNWMIGQTVTVTGVDDGRDDGTQRFTEIVHTGSGVIGDYGHVVDKVPVTVIDDDHRGVKVSKQSHSIYENGDPEEAYTLTLGDQPAGEVVITLSAETAGEIDFYVHGENSGPLDPITATFNQRNWNRPKYVFVRGFKDDDHEHESVTISHTVNGYGDVVTAESVTIKVIDIDKPGVVFEPESITVDEGGTATYTVKLATQPSGPHSVVVSPKSSNEKIATVRQSVVFDDANWNVAREIAVTGVQDSDAATGYASINHTVGNYHDEVTTAGPIEVTVRDDEARLILSESGLIVVYEGLPTTVHQIYQVRLAGKPGGTVTVTPVSRDPTKVSPSGSLTFDTENWSRGQNIVLRGEWDEDGDDDYTYIDHNVTGYDAPPVSKWVLVRDYHGRTLNLRPRELNLVRGEISSYRIKLRTNPGVYPGSFPDLNAQVTVTPNIADDSIATVVRSPLTFDFNSWAVDQDVTVTANNGNFHGTKSTTISHTVSGYRGYSDTNKGDFYNPALQGQIVSEVKVNVTDPDPGYDLLRTSVTVSEGDGASNSINYLIRLASVPDANVTVSLTSANESVATVFPATLRFTPSNARTPQIVTIRGVDDHIVNAASRRTNVNLSARGGDYDGVSTSVRVTVTDDDERGLVFVPGKVTVAESGGTNTYTVALSSLPTHAVSVAVATSDRTAATVNPATLNFSTTNWMNAKTVTVTGVDDDLDNNPDRSTTINHSASGGDYGAVTGDVAVSVTDDEASPTVSLALSKGSISENGGSATVTAELSGKSSAAVTVDVAAARASGAGGFEMSANTRLTIAAGATRSTGTVTITATDDDLSGPNTTVTVAGTANGGGVADPSSKTLTITDDEGTPTVNLALSESSISENGGTTTVTASLSGASSAAVTVDVTATRTSGAGEFELSNNKRLTIVAGTMASSGTVTITATNNDVDAPDTTVTVAGTANGSGVANPDSQTLTITDDDELGLVFIPDVVTVAEAGGTGTYTVALGSEPTGAVSVALASGTASAATVNPANLDFTTTNWMNGQTVTVTGVDDDLDNNPDRSTTISHTASGGDYASVTGDVSVSVTDDETTPTVSLALSKAAISENGGTTTVTAELSGKSSSAVNVTVAATVASGTGAFTLSTNKTLTIAAGTTSSTGTVTITATNNDVDAPNTTVTVAGTASGGGVANPTAKTLTITDDEATPTVSLALSSSSISENGGSTTVTATLTGTSSEAVTIDVSATAVSGSGAFALSTNKRLTIAAGATSSTGTVTITATNNDVDAPNTTVTVAGTASGGGVANPSSKTLTITDDDGTPTVSLALSKSSIGENGGSTTVTASLSGASSEVVTVDVAATRSSGDGAFSLSPNKRLTIAAGNTTSTGTVTITATNNDVDAPDTTVTVAGAASGGGVANPTAKTLTITDDEGTPTVSLALSKASISENGGSTTVTASLSGKSSAAVTVTVGVTRTSGDATFALSSNKVLKIAAGATTSTGTVMITATNDDVDAPNTTVTVAGTASGGVANPTAKTLTITDDEGTPTVSLALSSSSISENGGSTTVTAELSGKSSAAVTVDVAATTASGSGAYTLSSNKRLTIAAGATSSTGTVTITATNNDVDAPNTTVTVAGTSSGGGIANPTSKTLTITDDDSKGLYALPIYISVTEESSTTYSIWLASEPTATVTVTIAANNTSIATVSPGTVTFNSTNWGTKTTVTVFGTTDEDSASDRTTINHSISSGDTNYDGEELDLNVRVVDNDVAGVVVSPLTVNVREGAKATYSLKLATKPQYRVEIEPTPSDYGAVTATSVITFEPDDEEGRIWSKPQTVTIVARPDNDASNEVVLIDHSTARSPDPQYQNLSDIDSVTVNVEDDDEAGVELSSETISLVEGNNASYKVRLKTKPSGRVTINLTNPDTGAVTVSPASMRFTASNWNKKKTVTVEAVHDADAVDESVSIEHSASGRDSDYSATLAIDDVLASVDDDEEQSLVLSKESVTVTEAAGTGRSTTYTVVLSSQPTATVTVSLASSDEGAAKVQPPSLSFSTGNWSVGKTVTVTGVDDTTDADRTASVTHKATGGDYAGITRDLPIAVTDDDPTPSGITLSVSPDRIAENASSGVSVALTATVNGTSTYATDRSVSVQVGAEGDPATEGSDYVTVGDLSISIPAGVQSNRTSFTLTPTDDSVDEPNETISVSGTATDIRIVR